MSLSLLVMIKTFSPHFDRLVRQAIRQGKAHLLKDGRRVEMMAMGLVLFPERIQEFWDDGRYADLAYFVEYLRAGVPADLKQTDIALYRNLTKGIDVIRRLGWHNDPRLRPGPLRIRAAAQRRREKAGKQV